VKNGKNRPDPGQLLEAFIASGHSDAAFATLVKELGGLVYSSARRRTNNPGLAEEITQNVFAILARKADSLQRHPSLPAWIMETTRLESARALRSEHRRHRKLAALASETPSHDAMHSDHPDDDADWKDAVPVLDAAIDGLPDQDRRIIFQRFYEGRKFSDIASRSGQSEAACKMRVKRALQKLSSFLTARGVTLSATAMASGLASELARAAPAQILAGIAPKALAASTSISTTTILANTLQTMSTAKTTTVTAAAVVALACIPLSRQYVEGSRLRSQLQAREQPALPSGSSKTKRPRPMPERTTARTAESLLASLDQPLDNRAIISSLLEDFFSTPLEQDLLFARIAQMSPEERAQLLEDVRTFPCDTPSKDLIAAAIGRYTPELSPRENLEREIATGRPSMTGQPMRNWAKSEPDAAPMRDKAIATFARVINFQLQWFAGNRVGKLQFHGAEEQSAATQNEPFCSIQVIPQNGVAQCGHVDPELVGPARFGEQIHPGQPLAMERRGVGNRMISCDRKLAIQLGLDFTASCQLADGDGTIPLLDLPPFKERPEMNLRPVGLRGNEESAGLAVQAVDRAGGD